MAARIAWNGGQEATIVRIDGERIELDSSIPLPPGSTPQATLRGSGERVRLKVRASRRLADATFRVEARLLDATRELRSMLAKAMREEIP